MIVIIKDNKLKVKTKSCIFYYMKLINKTAIITGAGQGLGKFIALELAKEKVSTILVGRHIKTLTQTKKEILRLNGKADIFVADISKAKELKWIDDVIKNSDLNILINNAGWSPPLKIVEKLTEKEIGDCFKINVFSMFYILKKVIPHFKKNNEGTIINISSRAGKNGYPRLALYSATKFAIEGLTQAVAKELEGTNVTCYSIAPGALNTPMREKLFGDAKLKENPKFTAQVIVKLLRGDIDAKSGESIDPSHFHGL